VDVFERFVFIALLINVMFLESFTNSFQLLLATKAETKIHDVLQTCQSQIQHHHKECEDQQNNFCGKTYSKKMATLGGRMSLEQPKR
jgi:pantothenate kinase